MIINNKRIAVFDIETDPFKYKRKPKPFCCAIYDGELYKEWWGDDCIKLMIDWLHQSKQDYMLYAHNGGKFDFFYLLEMGALDNPFKIINGRIVSANLGNHTLKDSYAILPIPLAAYQKDDIDYNIFEKNLRELNKNDILHYLSKDCEYLYDIVIKFLKRFGDNLTIGSTSIKQIKKFHKFKHQKESHDNKFREYYFGGRVQCFKKGEINRNVKCYDVNSMYPFVMSELNHPTGNKYENISPGKLDSMGNYKDCEFYFITFKGKQNNALPSRTDKGLNFNIKEGIFKTTSWEFKTALKYNLLDIDEIIDIKVPIETINFKEFISHYMQEKILATENNDKASKIFSKLMMNSGYGKFGQNPKNYFDYFITSKESGPLADPWDIDKIGETHIIWKKPSPKPIYYDVATAASITSAARAVLLDAIQNSCNPLYCDTDSIICESLNAEIHESKLGAWDIEAEGDTIYLASKKLYALFDGPLCVKSACKGVRLSGKDIAWIALGQMRRWDNKAPSFKLDGNYNFSSRLIKKR